MFTLWGTRGREKHAKRLYVVKMASDWSILCHRLITSIKRKSWLMLSFCLCSIDMESQFFSEVFITCVPLLSHAVGTAVYHLVDGSFCNCVQSTAGSLQIFNRIRRLTWMNVTWKRYFARSQRTCRHEPLTYTSYLWHRRTVCIIVLYIIHSRNLAVSFLRRIHERHPIAPNPQTPQNTPPPAHPSPHTPTHKHSIGKAPLRRK